MEVDEDDIEQPSSSDNKATKKRFEVKKVRCQKPELLLFRNMHKILLTKFFCSIRSLCSGVPLHYGLGVRTNIFLYNFLFRIRIQDKKVALFQFLCVIAISVKIIQHNLNFE